MKQWALTICVSCILVGALEMILPKKQCGKSIKTVLALYILLSVLNGNKTLDFKKLPLTNFQLSTPDYSEYLDALSWDATKEVLEQQFQKEGVEGEIQFYQEKDRPAVLCISPTPDTAEELLTSLLLPGTPIKVIRKDS